MILKEKSILLTMQGRLDISARGLWNSYEKTFFGIRITSHNDSNDTLCLI